MQKRQQGFVLILTLALVGVLCLGVTVLVQDLRYALKKLEEDRQRARARDLVRYALDQAKADIRRAMGMFAEELGPARTLYDEAGLAQGFRAWKQTEKGLFASDVGAFEKILDKEDDGPWGGYYRYQIKPYGSGEKKLPPAGVVLANVAAGGLRVNLRDRYSSLGDVSAHCLWEDDHGYGPLESVLASYVGLVNDVNKQENGRGEVFLMPRGHATEDGNGEYFLPPKFYRNASQFFKQNPFEDIVSVPTSRRDPARFALYPWVLEASVLYSIKVERHPEEDLYDVHFYAKPKLILYNPYNVGLDEMRYDLGPEGDVFILNALVSSSHGGGVKDSARTLSWTLSTQLKAGERKEVTLDESIETWHSMGKGVDVLHVSVQPVSVSRVHGAGDVSLLFSGDTGSRLQSLFQRIVSPQWQVQDFVEGAQSILNEPKVFALNDSLEALSHIEGPVEFFEIRYRPSVFMEDWGAPVVMKHEPSQMALAIPEATPIKFPTSIESVMDLMPGLQRYFDGFALTPLAVRETMDEAAEQWVHSANTFLWDAAYYPGEASPVVPYSFLEEDYGSESALLVGVINVNEVSSLRWANFFKRYAANAMPSVGVTGWERLAKAIADVVSVRTGPQTVADFVTSKGGQMDVLSLALEYTGLNARVARDSLLKVIGGRLVARVDTFRVLLHSHTLDVDVYAEALLQGVLKEGKDMGGQTRFYYDLDVIAFRWLNKSSLLHEKEAAY